MGMPRRASSVQISPAARVLLVEVEDFKICEEKAKDFEVEFDLLAAVGAEVEFVGNDGRDRERARLAGFDSAQERF